MYLYVSYICMYNLNIYLFYFLFLAAQLYRKERNCFVLRDINN